LINQKEETHSKLDELTNMLEQNKDSLKDIVADNNNKQLQIQLLELNISKLRDEQDKNKIESKDFYEGILEKKDTTLKKLEEELKSNQIEIREIQNDLIKNKELLSQKENDITTLSNSNSENLINISALQHKLDSKIIRHKEKIKSKDIHIREKEEIITLKETEINNLKNTIKSLDTELSSSNAKNEDLSKSILKIKDETNTNSTKIENLSRELVEKAIDFNNKEKELKILHDQMIQQKGGEISSIVNDFQNQIDNLKSKLDERNKTIETLQEQINQEISKKKYCRRKFE